MSVISDIQSFEHGKWQRRGYNMLIETSLLNFTINDLPRGYTYDYSTFKRINRNAHIDVFEIKVMGWEIKNNHMKPYPLINTWLGLEICGGYVSASHLEAKLAEGFEVSGLDGSDFSKTFLKNDTHVALAIGKQLKKQTRAEMAIDLLNKIYNGDGDWSKKEIQKILEMSE